MGRELDWDERNREGRFDVMHVFVTCNWLVWYLGRYLWRFINWKEACGFVQGEGHCISSYRPMACCSLHFSAEVLKVDRCRVSIAGSNGGSRESPWNLGCVENHETHRGENHPGSLREFFRDNPAVQYTMTSIARA